MTAAGLAPIAALRDIDPILLTGIVRDALKSSSAMVLGWNARSITFVDPAANPGNGGLYRVSGTARDGGTLRRWSVVVKVLKNPAGTVMPGGHVISAEETADMTTFAYWRRESLAFASGLLRDLPDGIAAPRCFGVTTHDEDRLWLWMEDIEDVSEAQWSPARYGDAAHRLGRLNGAFAGSRGVPEADWMSPAWLRSWLDVVGTLIVGAMEQMQLWQHPAALKAFPEPIESRLMRLWAERERLLGMLERLPRTLAHLDAHRANLMFRRNADGGAELTAVDWAFVGPAALGEELAPLVVGSALQGAVALDELAEVERRALREYVHGLRAAGWAGDERLVRQGYIVSAALRYSFIAVADILRSTFDAEQAANAERAQGRPFAAILADRAALVYFLLDRADEALAMVP